MVMTSFPPQMGVCLATDQRLASSIISETCNKNTIATISSEQAEETIPKVLCIGNLRHVAPYFIQKELAVGKLGKGKTVGQALAIDNLARLKETSSIVKDTSFVNWWPKELLAGRLTIANSQNQQCQTIVATPDHLIIEGDVLKGRYHFHEQAILANPRPTIVHRDENYIVMNKPGGIDVLSNPDAHRVVNSLPGIAMEILNAKNDPQSSIKTIIPAHRIDNPVSGLVCCGTNNKNAKRLSRKIQSRDTVKTYLARVRVTSNGAMNLLNNLPFEIEVPLGFDTSIACAVVDLSAKGKASRTIILAVMVEGSLDDETCVIAVRPHTGRKHQLRKHLAHVGLPIANDTKYNTDGNNNGCSLSSEKISAFGLPNPPKQLVKLYESHQVDHCDHCKYIRRLLQQTTKISASGTGPSVSQPIWLHSWRYKFPSLGLSFEATPPEWAQRKQWKNIASEVLD